MSAASIAAWNARITWPELPPDVQSRARVCFTNDLGALLGGLPTPAARIAAQWAQAEGEGRGRLIGAERAVPFAAAALANGVAGSTLDYDGGHYLGGGIHPGPAVLGSLLSILDTTPCSLQDLYLALAVGYEVAIRLGYLLWPEDRSGQAHTSGTAVAVGAAAACAKLLGLSAVETQHAIEISWAHAPMAALQFPMVKESLGWSAATGLSSARLARLGFKGQSTDAPAFASREHPPTPFDNPRAQNSFVQSLGERWHLLDVYFKPHAACRYTHAAVDAALALSDEPGLDPDAIERIVVHTHHNALFLTDVRPADDDTAQFSFPWILAAALGDGRVGAEQIDPARLSDERLLRLAAKVVVRHDPALDHCFPSSYPARVEIARSDGTVLIEERLAAHGDLSDPMTEAELAEKFLRLAKRVLVAAEAELLYELLCAPQSGNSDGLIQALDEVKLPA